MPEIVTANLLRSGEVVYLGSDGLWVRRIAEAAVAADADARARLEQIAAASAARQEVTAVYAMDVVLDGTTPHPKSQRERIRAAHGPTV